MAKLIVAFRNFRNVPKIRNGVVGFGTNCDVSAHENASMCYPTNGKGDEISCVCL
jgi:hypothetical protein